MRYRALVFLLMFMSAFTLRAYGYELTTDDLKVYEFVNGEKISEGTGGRNVYIVEESRQMIFVKKENSLTGEAPNILANPAFTITSKEEGTMVATRTWDLGEEVIIFYKNGSYYFMRIIHPDLSLNETDTHVTVAFGNYYIDLKYLE